MAAGKVDVVVNYGDDGNGCTVTAYIHIPGTINDIAFSALQIEVLEKAIYRVSYGAHLRYDCSNSLRTEKIPYRFY